MRISKMLGLRQILALFPYSKRHLYRLEKAGRFPPRVKVGPRRVAWSESDIEQFLASLKVGE